MEQFLPKKHHQENWRNLKDITLTVKIIPPILIYKNPAETVIWGKSSAPPAPPTHSLVLIWNSHRSIKIGVCLTSHLRVDRKLVFQIIVKRKQSHWWKTNTLFITNNMFFTKNFSITVLNLNRADLITKSFEFKCLDETFLKKT